MRTGSGTPCFEAMERGLQGEPSQGAAQGKPGTAEFEAQAGGAHSGVKGRTGCRTNG